MGEDERKKIAELYFGTDKAEKGLIRIEEKLKNLTQLSENYNKTMQKSLSAAVNPKSMTVNAENAKKISKATSEYIIKQNIKENTQKRIEENKTAEHIARVNAETNTKMIRDAAQTADKIAVLEQQRINNAEKHSQKMEQYNARQVNSTKTMYDKISSYAKTYLIYQGFNELRQQAQELVKEMVNVEYQMVQIDRVLNDSSVNINDYRDRLIQLAYDYGNSFENVADITLRLAQAGFDAQESLALTEKTLLALNTAELNATQATSDMVAIMAQWNLMTGTATEQSEAYAGIIDKINKVADNFPTTSEDILNALKKTSSAFNLAGASIDETIALITTAEIASQRGGKAIGTAMSNIIQQLKEEGRLNIMESLGIDVYADEAKTEFNSIIDIITQLSEKMQELKSSGKESSVEMQELLSVFTVFRRNIGAGLLSGVAGEDSTYQQVLKTSMDSLGYSMQENEKHMKTAKAALEQFNATLLELKTTVWDGGVENVFRGMLLLGSDVAENIKGLVENFGAVPTAVGAATLAFTSFQKQVKLQVSDGKIGFTGNLAEEIKKAKKEVEQILKPMDLFENSNIELSESMQKYVDKVDIANVSTKGYIGYLAKMKVATIAAQGATLLLNAALSLGLSAGISLLLKGFDNLIHAEEKDIERKQKAISTTQDTIDKTEKEIETIDDLVKKYEQLNSVPFESLDDTQKAELQAVQENITKQLKIQNEYVSEMNGNYDKQLDVLKQVSNEKLQQQIIDQRNLVNLKKQLQEGIDLGFWANYFGTSSEAGFITSGVDYAKTFEEISGRKLDKRSETYNLAEILDLANFDEQIKLFEKLQEELEVAQAQGKDVGEAFVFVSESLNTLREKQEEVVQAQQGLNELLGEGTYRDLIGNENIENVEQYKTLLEDISNLQPPSDYTGSVEDFRYEIEQLAKKAFPDLQNEIDRSNGILNAFKGSLENNIEDMEGLSNIWSNLKSGVQEFNNSGHITIDTFKNLVNDDVLQYLEIVNGKLKINETAFIDAANSAKEKAISDLQAEAAAEILSIVEADLNTNLEETQKAGQISAEGSKIAANAALEAARGAIIGATSFDAFNKAMANEGFDYSGVSQNAQKQIDTVLSTLNKRVKTINALSLTAARSSAGASKSATDAFKEQSEERVRIFKQEIDDYESLEKAWVNKYKKLELFGTNDLKFITHQRINRYNDYLNQIRNLTGISEEDRTALLREYTTERQQLELEYFDLLKQQLEEQIDALEKVNDEKIKLIEEEADAQIEALQKVEDENDRIRQKEEYEKKRNELIYGHQGIEYWRQRTGAEAQRALLEAEQELAELDKDWEEKKEGWTLEDQIEEIEKARDAQIAAIEEAQEIQIQAWRDAYQAQVNLYAETGQIIYDNSVITAGYLYDAYMNNFVNPLNVKLREITSAINSASQAANNVAQKVGVTPVNNKANVLQSNPINNTSPNASPYNKLSETALPLRKFMAKFHGGGKVATAAEEALAIVRKNEVVLRPEWAAGLDKLVQQINSGGTLNNTSNSTNVNVYGNLANFDAIKVNERKDAANIEKMIVKVLEDKFNIKK